jgi:cysteinyl-tRNA synthetase
VPDNEAPDGVRRLAEARRDARAARDFGTADRLKADIESAGWKVVDVGGSYRLEPAHRPDVVADGRVRYGWSGAVPSRLAEAPSGVASVVLVAPDDPDALEAFLAGLAGTVDDAVQRIVVANAPPAEAKTLLVRLEERWAVEAGAGPVGETVWTAERLGAAAALNAGIRRAAAAVVVVLAVGVEVGGDFVDPLVAALTDPGVGVAGPWGLVSDDLRRFQKAEAGAGDVTAIDGRALAFRRADYADRGPLDEHFVAPALLDAWWSLVLRDEGQEPPRRAVVVDVPLVARAPAPADFTDEAAGPDRGERRNRYRIINRFGGRGDLATG